MNSTRSGNCLTGLDNLLAGLDGEDKRILFLREQKKIGLVSNSRALDERGEVNLTSLLGRGIKISCIFTPEHGYFANIRDGDYIADGAHPELGIPLYSLFTEGHEKNAVAVEGGREGVSSLIFDIQDAGVRFYTYIHALGLAIAGARELGIPLIVLDRPNPAGLEFTEGFLPEPSFHSEICPFDIPARYALTIGELASFIAKKYYPGATVSVIPVEGYSRKMYFADTGLEFHPPSPAMISAETAAFYPGTCFIEGTNMSEGRGTVGPFRIIGAPFCDAERICAALRGFLDTPEFNGIKVEPVAFTPTQSKYEGTACGGVMLKSEKAGFRAMKFGLIVIKTIYDIHRKEIEFIRSPKSGLYFFDRLAGTSAVRETIVSGSLDDVIGLEKLWEPQIKKFGETCAEFKIYS